MLELNKKEYFFKLKKQVEEKAREIGRQIKIMHLCGTHEDTITKYNMREILPENVKLLSGPGCPVCIIPEIDILNVIHLAKSVSGDVIVTSFGDMLRVPAGRDSLYKLKTSGKRVEMVYSIFDAIEIARKNPSNTILHFAIGFETTMPSTSLSLEDGVENFVIYSAHRYFVPAVDALLSLPGFDIDAFINPGHVSAIVGMKPYRRIAREHENLYQVVAGFEPIDVLLGIDKLLDAMLREDNTPINEYSRIVPEEGNKKALELFKKTFERGDAEWRELGVLKNTGAYISKRYANNDAMTIYKDILDEFKPPKIQETACRCGEVLLGKIEPEECKLFMKSCTPRRPIGPCMVSHEGTCNIRAKYLHY